MASRRPLPPLTPEIMNQRLSDVFDELLYVETLLQNKEESYVSNYITIRLVTILEQFCRKIIEYQIKHEDKIDVPTMIEIRTSDLDKTETITKANVIPLAYTFHNMDGISSTFNSYHIKDIWNYIDVHVKEEIKKLLFKRHNVVHTVSSMNYDVRCGYDALEAFMKYTCRAVFKTDGEFYSNKGWSLSNLDKFIRAIECFDKAISSNPDDYLAYVYKGHALVKLKKSTEAIKCFDKAIEIDPEDGFTHASKGRALIDLKKPAEAIKYFDKAIELDPEDDFTHASKGFALMDLEKPAEAIKCFDKAIELDPEEDFIHTSKGLALMDLEKPAEAIKCFDKAIELVPNDSLACDAKDDALKMLGKHADAD